VSSQLKWQENPRTACRHVINLFFIGSCCQLFPIQAILLAGGVGGLPVVVWAKAVSEMLDRLPLSLVATTSRLTTSAEFAVSAEACLRSCNVLFDVFVNQIKVIRASNEFQTLWLRFTSILANNTCVLPRGVHFHEEMLEMIAALMRLLRPPVLPAPVLPAFKETTKPVLTPNETKGAFSFLFSWGTSESASLPTEVEPDTNSELHKQLHSAVSTAILTPSKLPPVSTSEEEDEGNLLVISWRAMCSLNPLLQTNLKLKNPQLVADLQRFVEVQDKRSVTLSTFPVAVSDSTEVGATIWSVTPTANSSGTTLPAIIENVTEESFSQEAPGVMLAHPDQDGPGSDAGRGENDAVTACAQHLTPPSPLVDGEMPVQQSTQGHSKESEELISEESRAEAPEVHALSPVHNSSLSDPQESLPVMSTTTFSPHADLSQVAATCSPGTLSGEPPAYAPVIVTSEPASYSDRVSASPDLSVKDVGSGLPAVPYSAPEPMWGAAHRAPVAAQIGAATAAPIVRKMVLTDFTTPRPGHARPINSKAHIV
jgi:hypothetical protein